MAYSELIKKFDNIRDYMREFYVYGFKSREQFEQKSTRTYDNEKRRIESYLGDYMGFHRTEEGKNVFLSIDSRSSGQNPLYKALKAKSFTDKDITLHFILFDILYSSNIFMTVNEIVNTIDMEYLSCFREPMMFDESTVRKKLKEYVELGLMKSKKMGRQIYYGRTENIEISPYLDALEFFAEAGMCGVIGSSLLDKTDNVNDIFSFKHHYITHALESEILCKLFEAISAKHTVIIENYTKRHKGKRKWELVPLRIFVSVQSGRRYLLGYHIGLHEMKSYRLDYITKVEIGGASKSFDELRKKLDEVQKHMWSVSHHKNWDLEHVEFIIQIHDGEEYIFHRLEREKRCGRVERIDRHHCRFVADVYDTNEMIPWIRTFICRITALNFSNRTIENRFRQDLEDMYRMYDMGGEE